MQWEKAEPWMRDKYLEEHYEYKNYTTGPESLQTEKMNIDQAVKFILSINEKTCRK